MEAGAVPRALRPVSCLLSQQHSHLGHVLYGSGPDTGVVAGALEVLTPSVLLPDSKRKEKKHLLTHRERTAAPSL